MVEGINKLNAVREALAELGANACPQELATFVESKYGLQVQPVIFTILLGSIKEQEHLAKVRELGRQIAEQAQKEGDGQRKKAGGRKERTRHEEQPSPANASVAT